MTWLIWLPLSVKLHGNLIYFWVCLSQTTLQTRRSNGIYEPQPQKGSKQAIGVQATPNPVIIINCGLTILNICVTNWQNSRSNVIAGNMPDLDLESDNMWQLRHTGTLVQLRVWIWVWHKRSQLRIGLVGKPPLWLRQTGNHSWNSKDTGSCIDWYN